MTESRAQQFVAFAIECGVLRFGHFELKSGRTSPYFFNSGLFDSGARLARLARFYASAIESSGVAYDMMFGPAYKGIPLVAAIAVSLAEHHARDVPWCFNRKEAKDHGEGGVTVGAVPRGRVVIVDDVISAGTSARESISILRATGATPVAVAVALDRQERGRDQRSAIQEIEQDLGLDVIRLATLDEVIDYLTGDPARASDLASLRAYRRRYGVGAGPQGALRGGSV